MTSVSESRRWTDTYSRELFKVDLAVVVFVQFLQQFPQLVARQGSPDLGEQVAQLASTDEAVTVQVWTGRRR